VLVNLFTPLPAAVLGMRIGPRWGVAAVGLTAVLVLATSEAFAVVPALLYVVQFGVPAMALPWLLSRGVGWDRAIVMTLGIMLALGVVVLAGVTSGSGQTVLSVIDTQIDKEIDQTISLMHEFAGSEQSVADGEAFRQMTEKMGAFMHRAYPGMLIVVCAAMQLVTVGLLALLVRPNRIAGPPFARWHSPELLIWVLIAAGFAVVFSAGAVQSVAINVLIVLLPVYFLQGLAVVEHFLRRKGWSPLIRSISYLLLLLVNPLPVIVTGVGVFDLWADFRKPRLNKS
jgi:uncharacterized protein YybS (DUF2232 family)